MIKSLPMLLSIALFSCSSAYAAHAKLANSTPADGSVDASPPSAFVLEFTESVILHEIYIKKDGEKGKSMHNLPHNDAKTVTIPAPPLAAGHYVLEWSVFTHDSIVLSGRIRFTISGEAAGLSPG